MKYGAPATMGATKLKLCKRLMEKKRVDNDFVAEYTKGRGEVMDDKDEAVKRIGARRFISIICNRIKRK